MKMIMCCNLSLFMLFCTPMTVFGMDSGGFWIFSLSEDKVKPLCETLKASAQDLPFSMYQDHDCLNALIGVSSMLGIGMESSKKNLQETYPPFVGYMNSSRVAIAAGLCLIENFIKKIEALEQEKLALKKQLEEKRLEKKQPEEDAKPSLDQSRLLGENVLFYKRGFLGSAFTALVLFAYILYDKYR